MRLVDRAIMRQSFWEEADFLARLSWRVHEFASWAKGCKCHEAERIAGASIPRLLSSVVLDRWGDGFQS